MKYSKYIYFINDQLVKNKSYPAKDLDEVIEVTEEVYNTHLWKHYDTFIDQCRCGMFSLIRSDSVEIFFHNEERDEWPECPFSKDDHNIADIIE